MIEDIVFGLLYLLHKEMPGYNLYFCGIKVHNFFKDNKKDFPDLLKNVHFSEKPGHTWSKELSVALHIALMANFFRWGSSVPTIMIDKISELKEQDPQDYERLIKIAEKRIANINKDYSKEFADLSIRFNNFLNRPKSFITRIHREV